MFRHTLCHPQGGRREFTIFNTLWLTIIMCCESEWRTIGCIEESLPLRWRRGKLASVSNEHWCCSHCIDWATPVLQRGDHVEWKCASTIIGLAKLNIKAGCNLKVRFLKHRFNRREEGRSLRAVLGSTHTLVLLPRTCVGCNWEPQSWVTIHVCATETQEACAVKKPNSSSHVCKGFRSKTDFPSDTNTVTNTA